MLFRKKAKSINRTEVAEELARIRTRRLIAGSAVTTDFGRKLSERLSKVQHEIWVELFLTHYTNGQLEALSEFYRSDMGRSIVETDRQIEREFQEELRARMERVSREMEAEDRSQPSNDILVGLASSFESDPEQ